MISPRTPETEAKYQDFKKSQLAAGRDLSVFDLSEEIILREFNHWLIIENRFPYDNMTSVNHMLVPRRQLKDLLEATEEEVAEHNSIRDILVTEAYYDALVENFPRSKSVHRHIHLHLVKWKYTTDSGQNKTEQ